MNQHTLAWRRPRVSSIARLLSSSIAILGAAVLWPGHAAGSDELPPPMFGPGCEPPSIQNQPLSVTLCHSSLAHFYIYDNGSYPRTYQWQWRPAGELAWIDVAEGRNTSAANDGTVFHAGFVDSELLVMVVYSTGGINGISLRCIFTNPCGSITSDAATLTLCVAETDDGSGTGTCDGEVTIDDLSYYLRDFQDGVSMADIDDGTGTGTRDGGVTIDDLLYYLQRFEAGC